jgi:hypothetical protein
MKKKSKRYSLELSETQLRTMAEAVEFYSRFLAGQIRIPEGIKSKLFDMHEDQSVLKRADDKYLQATYIEVAKRHIDDLKLTLFPELEQDASYGMGQKIPHDEISPKIIATTYDLYRQILEHFADGSGSYNVYAHKGIRYSGEPDIKIRLLAKSKKTTKIDRV